jgi:hypothetical protein
MKKSKVQVVWTDYMQFRAKHRGYQLNKIEEIVRYSAERYFDTVTHRQQVVGKHDKRLVVIAMDREGDKVTPVTVHAITRQQIIFRLRSGRFIHE